MTARTARRLPVHAGPPAWDAILPARVPGPVLEGGTTADVVVIGAGFAGLSAARRLLQINVGARVVVLEAGRIGEGATGRNSGFMIDLPHELTSEDYAGASQQGDGAMTALNRHAIAFAREAVAEYGIDPNYFDPAGKVNGAASAGADAHNHSYATRLEALGEPYEMLDAQAMCALTGSRHYRSGLYTPGTVVLQPAGYVRGLADGLVRAGVRIFEKTPVTRFARRGSDWQVEARGGAVTAPRVILAVNGHLESFGFHRNRLMHVFLFASMTEELPPEALARLGGHSRWGITPADPMGTTLRRIDTGQGGNRLVARSVAVYKPGMETTPAEMTRATATLRRKFDARFPQLADIRMEHVWSGHLCLSRNGVSVARALEPGLFSACCQNGLGTTRGTLTGIAAAEAASGITSPVADFFAAQDSPTRLPPPPLSTIGATATMRWKEWGARQE